MTAKDKFFSDDFAVMMMRRLGVTKIGRIIVKEIEQERQAAIE
ncbi:hypothetical protein [Salicibibacter cibi]|nr:hypothetical protein [Salicibibacter cibi]